MAFSHGNSVYHALSKLFPTVDYRLIKAISIEHAKDANEAANVVLTEILPYMSLWSVDEKSPSNNIDSCDSPGDGDEHVEHGTLIRHQFCNNELNATTSSALESEASYNYSGGSMQHIESKDFVDEMSVPMSYVAVGSSHSAKRSGDLFLSAKSAETDEEFHLDQATSVSSRMCQENVITLGHMKTAQHVPPINKIDGIDGACGNINDQPLEWVDCDGFAGDLKAALDEEGHNDQVLSSQNCATPLDLTSADKIPVGETMKSQEPNLESIVARSGQVCTTTILEGIIEDAKVYKRTLFSAMESVVCMMREVEIHAKAADEAKEKPVNGGLDILDKVEEFKQMLARAKEANDMHAGEVSGDKAILATEARELQLHLLSLSDERDKSLAMLDEMRQTLERRLASTEEVRKAAEQERLVKEKDAQKALAEQEAIMEKVVQESKLLKKQAEENSKLRDFLVDRGHLVDSLQGELYVICQDVKILKQKFDERLPLSESFSSCQTSCILASSSSFKKNASGDLVTEQDVACKPMSKVVSIFPSDFQSAVNAQEEVFKSLSCPSPSPASKGQPMKSEVMEETAPVDHKVLVDDEWLFCDRDEF